MIEKYLDLEGQRIISVEIFEGKTGIFTKKTIKTFQMGNMRK